MKVRYKISPIVYRMDAGMLQEAYFCTLKAFELGFWIGSCCKVRDALGGQV